MGRLDQDTTGLLILTNDSAFGDHITSPESKVPKTYLVKASMLLDDEQLEQLRQGLALADGPTRPAIVKRIRDAAKYTFFEITITEGRNRQVRRMVEALGAKVLKLVRTADRRHRNRRPGDRQVPGVGGRRNRRPARDALDQEAFARSGPRLMRGIGRLLRRRAEAESQRAGQVELAAAAITIEHSGRNVQHYRGDDPNLPVGKQPAGSRIPWSRRDPTPGARNPVRKPSVRRGSAMRRKARAN